MTIPTITVTVRSSQSDHEGGTKHYAAVMISFKVSNSGRTYSTLIRIHGSIGKASRVNVEGFENATLATDAYKKLVKDKDRRGYESMVDSSGTIFSETLDCEINASRLFLDKRLQSLMLDTGITSNSKPESLSSLLSEHDQEDLAHEVELLMRHAIDGGLEQHPSEDISVETQRAISERHIALEQKRIENYGESWGSW